jgi:hypothetical protein
MRVLFVLLAVLAQKEHHLRGDGWQYYCLGNCLSSTSSVFPTTSYSLTPGRILMGGGTDVDDAYKWLISNSDNGNVVVFREFLFDVAIFARSCVLCARGDCAQALTTMISTTHTYTGSAS